MKIVGVKFILEANENVPKMCDIENVAFDFGEKAIEAMQLGTALNDKSVEFIPLISANAGCSGVMKYTCFMYIHSRIIEGIKKHLHEIDGIYLHFHGASSVEKIGSGDFYLLKKIREITGPYLPIVISCDPHGNLCKEYVENTQLIRSYRHSPHTDVEETNEFVFNQLKNLIVARQNIHSIYRKLPIILGGEQSVSLDEPVVSINKYLNDLEYDSKIRSASWHVGYIRHDCYEAGCGIVVVPQTEEDREYCELKADELAEYVFNKRHEFHYTGSSKALNEALEEVLLTDEKPNFITDSGDNVTAGALGSNTYILQEILTHNYGNKKILFASINDDVTYSQLNALSIGESVTINLGKNYDELSSKVKLNVEIIEKAEQKGTKLFGEYDNNWGSCIRVKVINTSIEIIVANTNHPFVEKEQCLAVGANWLDYDLVIIKCGYAFPEMINDGKIVIMALTDGATLQDTSQLSFKRIMRPMYPIDKI